MYKYDPVNGYRNADQINADKEEFNKYVVEITDAVKKLPPDNVREAMNIISCRDKIGQTPAKYSVNEKGELIRDDAEAPNSTKIAEEIRNDIEEDENHRKIILNGGKEER